MKWAFLSMLALVAFTYIADATFAPGLLKFARCTIEAPIGTICQP